ncbi:hypothetical protein [Amycolatopsis sp. lyj-109]|uniref:hypothetical protein n=1 Tax=Amycolatopsis sp. lyj-109 TaxID=2789287 RepID=UPI00397DCEFE
MPGAGVQVAATLDQGPDVRGLLPGCLRRLGFRDGRDVTDGEDVTGVTPWQRTQMSAVIFRPDRVVTVDSPGLPPVQAKSVLRVAAGGQLVRVEGLARAVTPPSR